ncbi:Elongation factor G_ mitochondrial [Caligus rogercresseyi]|uniref:Elongation factor G_ mitochondrial n=1 Tax=Caligus rogercresseyi TaxID=217165 RepID=A0A7T8KI50_CALRO|nr:Elongation factor G_ mitochondrial [Caligus rogercresseyi]
MMCTILQDHAHARYGSAHELTLRQDFSKPLRTPGMNCLGTFVPVVTSLKAMLVFWSAERAPCSR